ncbi:hypothetical protein KIPB_004161, partial [Kipferlia bialata]
PALDVTYLSPSLYAAVSQAAGTDVPQAVCASLRDGPVPVCCYGVRGRSIQVSAHISVLQGCILCAVVSHPSSTGGHPAIDVAYDRDDSTLTVAVGAGTTCYYATQSVSLSEPSPSMVTVHLHSLPSLPSTCVSLSLSGRVYACLGQDGEVYVWNRNRVNWRRRQPVVLAYERGGGQGMIGLRHGSESTGGHSFYLYGGGRVYPCEYKHRSVRGIPCLDTRVSPLPNGAGAPTERMAEAGVVLLRHTDVTVLLNNPQLVAATLLSDGDTLCVVQAQGVVVLFSGLTTYATGCITSRSCISAQEAGSLLPHPVAPLLFINQASTAGASSSHPLPTATIHGITATDQDTVINPLSPAHIHSEASEGERERETLSPESVRERMSALVTVVLYLRYLSMYLPANDPLGTLLLPENKGVCRAVVSLAGLRDDLLDWLSAHHGASSNQALQLDAASVLSGSTDAWDRSLEQTDMPAVSWDLLSLYVPRADRHASSQLSKILTAEGEEREHALSEAASSYSLSAMHPEFAMVLSPTEGDTLRNRPQDSLSEDAVTLGPLPPLPRLGTPLPPHLHRRLVAAATEGHGVSLSCSHDRERERGVGAAGVVGPDPQMLFVSRSGQAQAGQAWVREDRSRQAAFMRVSAGGIFTTGGEEYAVMEVRSYLSLSRWVSMSPMPDEALLDVARSLYFSILSLHPAPPPGLDGLLHMMSCDYIQADAGFTGDPPTLADACLGSMRPLSITPTRLLLPPPLCGVTDIYGMAMHIRADMPYRLALAYSVLLLELGLYSQDGVSADTVHAVVRSFINGPSSFSLPDELSIPAPLLAVVSTLGDRELSFAQTDRILGLLSGAPTPAPRPPTPHSHVPLAAAVHAVAHAPKGVGRVSVSRLMPLQSGLEACVHLSPAKHRLKVVFQGERGLDAGGLTRTAITLVVDGLLREQGVVPLEGVTMDVQPRPVLKVVHTPSSPVLVPALQMPFPLTSRHVLPRLSPKRSALYYLARLLMFALISGTPVPDVFDDRLLQAMVGSDDASRFHIPLDTASKQYYKGDLDRCMMAEIAESPGGVDMAAIPDETIQTPNTAHTWARETRQGIISGTAFVKHLTEMRYGFRHPLRREMLAGLPASLTRAAMALDVALSQSTVAELRAVMFKPLQIDRDQLAKVLQASITARSQCNHLRSAIKDSALLTDAEVSDFLLAVSGSRVLPPQGIRIRVWNREGGYCVFHTCNLTIEVPIECRSKREVADVLKASVAAALATGYSRA